MSSEPSEAPPRVTTQVGHSRFGDNAFRGYSMQRELSARVGFWSIVALALGARRPLDAAGERCMDDIAVATQAADPRVWPLKLARLVSSYGSSAAGLAAAVRCAEGSLIGPWSAHDAAELLLALEAELEDLEDLEDAALARQVDASVARRLERGERFKGFGVPMREIDERVVLLRRIVAERHASVPGRYWRLAHALEASLRAQRNVGMNVGGAVAALCLDMGFSAAQIGPLTILHATTSFLAHAHEGAAQQEAVVQELPQSLVEYVGPPARRSPRADG